MTNQLELSYFTIVQFSQPTTNKFKSRKLSNSQSEGLPNGPLVENAQVWAIYSLNIIYSSSLHMQGKHWEIAFSKTLVSVSSTI